MIDKIITSFMQLPVTAQIVIVAIVLFIFCLPAIKEEVRDSKRA